MKTVIKKIRFILILGSLIQGSVVDAHTIIRAEDTPRKYIKAEEIEKNQFRFSECSGDIESLQCEELEGITRTYSRKEIKKLADMNERYAYYAAGADVVIGVASLYFGLIIGAKATAAYYAGAGISLDGGVAAVGGTLYGVPSGAAVGTGITVALDALDPFVHRDMSIAYEEIIGVASDSNLEDVEAVEVEGNIMLEIEDIEFEQLKSKIIDQLQELD